MFEKSEKFPEGWFFIKNHSNGYVLMVDNESHETGAHVVLSSLRTKDYSAQLWRYDPSGYIVNKKSGQVMDVAKGSAKAGVDIVQQILSHDAKAQNNYQKFGLSPHGHIFLTQKPDLVLGIKESFFSRREGLHVHLQLVDKRHLDRKEQRWDFVLPVVKEVHEPLKRSISTKSTSSASLSSVVVDTRSIHSNAESTNSGIDHSEANAVPIGSFPETAFFLKSDVAGLYISVENASSVSAGTQLTLENIRKKNYDSQIWTYDANTHRIVNKHSGLVLGVSHNSIKDGASIVQAASSTSNEKTQAWIMSPEGEIALKHDSGYVIGFKESWFGSREGAHLYLQKRNKSSANQRFTVVLPVFKKSTETNVKTETRGVFPEGWFFVKNQARGLVLTVLETGVISAEVAASKLDKANYSRQLWKFDSGFIVNKASEMVLDVRGGSLKSGAGICQYTRKEKDNENQQWALTPEGSIFIQANKNLVLTVKENETVRSKLYLSERKPGHKEQCWNFVLPVFRKKQTTTVTKTTIRYAAYPAGWFFIRSYCGNSTTEAPLVLTSHEKSITLSLLDKENWHQQLWTFSSGKLINYATDLAIDVSTYATGGQLIQSKSTNQKWYMTTDGYLFYGSSDAKLALLAETEDEKCRLSLSEFKASQDFRWGLLLPKFVYRSGVQILTHWSIAFLKEWGRNGTNTSETNTQSVAEWPEGEFYIGGPDNHALAPEKLEDGSRLVMKTLSIEQSKDFRWTVRGNYLVHCATGLMMRIQSDNFTEGTHLILSSESKDDIHQLWTLRMNGSIVSKANERFGLSFIQSNDAWIVQITTTLHYSWRILYGKYEMQNNQQSSRLIGFRRVVLIACAFHNHANVERKLVTHSYGVFPKGWVFIRSKIDSGLYITVSDKKKGAKLILSKLDFKSFRRQLWRYREDGCIVNFDTDYVIDVAGGKLFSNANIIQWSPKFLLQSRKNQVWSLSTEGHIHPQSNSSLVLSPSDSKIKENVELKLVKCDSAALGYQQWTFATPVFSSSTHTTYAAQQAHKDTLTLERVGDSCSVDVSSTERYERVNKRIIIRRWGVFPDGSFFIRCAYGDKHMALTVEQNEAGSYQVVIRSLNFKEYKWQLWTFKDGHLINEQTGLVLDAQPSEDTVIEDEQPQVYLKPKALNVGQFWDLGVDGEIHLRSNEKLVIGVSNVGDASREGAKVGIRKTRIVRTNVGARELISLKSEQWLRWTFTKPVFGKRIITTTTKDEATLEIEKTEDQTVVVKEQDEEIDDDEEEESNEQEVDDGEESEYEIQTPTQTPSSSTTTSNSAPGVSVVVAGAAINVAAGETVNVISRSKETEKESTIAQVTALDSEISPQKSTSSKSQRLHRKDSFQLEEDYVPTGFEKIARFKTHHGNFPNGYFFIKNSLHGFVLGVVGDVKDGAYLALTRMKSSDYADQLWSYRNERLVNLKGDSLVLDAAKADLVAGERVHLSIPNSFNQEDEDQTWEHNPEGFIHLKSRSSFVLSLKETKRSDKLNQIDVFVQEAKSLVKKQARPEQHWEVLIPALIPVSQGESGVKIVESGKVDKITSSASAIVTYKWLKETYCHKITVEDQWPETQGWFFIRYGTEKHFIASGETAQSQVGVYELSENIDHRRFLWAVIDNYLINYKYMLRLILNTSQKWVLSSSRNTLNQKFHISTNGSISIRTSKTIYYMRLIRTNSKSYDLSVTSDTDCLEAHGFEIHIPVISDVEYQKDAVTAFTSANRWICKQKSDWSTLNIATSRRGVFPPSTWFFMKVVSEGSDNLVLSTQPETSQLVLKKLDFQSFRNQLWTFNNGLLINYGSKLVIDVEGNVSASSKIVHKAEAGVSTQKWFLTTDGHIELDSHDYFTIGTKKIADGAEVLLGSTKNFGSVKSIHWKFSTPIFGKKTTSGSTVSTDLGLTKALEDGAVISGTKDVVSSDGISQLVSTPFTKHYIVICRDIYLIVNWWKIVFARRLILCQTKQEYLDVSEEYRRILRSRLVRYVEIHGSALTAGDRLGLEHIIEKTQGILEEQVFEKIKELPENNKQIDANQLNLSKLVSNASNTIEEEFKGAVKEAGFDFSDFENVSNQSPSADKQPTGPEQINSLLVVVDSVYVTVRYWFKTLHHRVEMASKDGASKEDISKIIKESSNEVQEKLSQLKVSANNTITHSISFDDEQKNRVKQAVMSTIDDSKQKVEQFAEQHARVSIDSKDKWQKTTAKVSDALSSKVEETKVIIQDTITDVVEEEKAITLGEEDVEASKIEVVTSLAESKTHISTWFNNIEKEIHWTLSLPSDHNREDLITIIDAAELEISSLIDEDMMELSVISNNLTYLSKTECQRMITHYINMKAYIIAYIRNIKKSVQDTDVEK
ncbi:hypothetical protein EDC96DRAFT_444829, partial [Choanephora cucurbitarum]